MNTGASAFVPKKISIKTPEGNVVDTESWRKSQSFAVQQIPPHVPSHQKRASAVIRMETVEAKNKRLAEEAEKAEKLKAEEEAKKAAEEEKLAKVEAEKERVRKEQEEKEQAEQERIRKEEEEKKRQEAEAERLRLEEEKKAEEAKLHKEAEERRLLEEAKEEGEIEPTEEAAQAKREPLKIDTALPSPDSRRRPGPLDLSGTARAVVAPPPPSALAAARVIDDLGRVPYPEGIQSPKIELNVNAKNGKFRYDNVFRLAHILTSSSGTTETFCFSSWPFARKSPTHSRLSMPSGSSPQISLRIPCLVEGPVDEQIRPADLLPYRVKPPSVSASLVSSQALLVALVPWATFLPLLVAR